MGTVTEGDLLRYIKEKWFLNIREAEDYASAESTSPMEVQTVDINRNMEDLVDGHEAELCSVLDDADNFIGIVRQK